MSDPSYADPPFACPPGPRERGLAISAANARSIGDCFPDLELAWGVRFKLPFSFVASKNAIYNRQGRSSGRVFIRNEARKYRDIVGFLAKDALRGIQIKHNKLWIDIFVEKPNHRGDAINVVDLICDGIKRAIPIDDRWYAIRRLDWSINKHDPHLFIGLAQEADATDSQICSYCGQIKPLSDFVFDSSARLGRKYFCIECRAPSFNRGPNKKNRSPHG